MTEEEKKKVEETRRLAYKELADTADFEEGLECDAGRAEAMLARVLRLGTCEDAAHAIRAFVDYEHACSELNGI